MVIDIDASRLPTGTMGWTALLSAVEAADPSDESEWIEFKAALDPTTVEGRFVVAKAIVAFANRDPMVASRWLGGHAVILIGIEPGNLVSAPDIDPADLQNSVGALLAAPAPHWDMTVVPYKGARVLVITVDPPRSGDPIACIGKTSGKAEDGQVFVRRVGKSDRAKSADLRRLASREAAQGNALQGLSVEPELTSEIPRITYPDAWIDNWLNAERSQLLTPLEPPEPPTKMPIDIDRLMGTAEKMAKFAAMSDTAMGIIRREETRTPDQFKSQVTEYLNECHEALAEAFEDLRASAAREVTLRLVNPSSQNFENVLVELHIEGEVFGYEDEGEFTTFETYLPKRPRKWGPWTENRGLGLRIPDYGDIFSAGHSISSIRPIGGAPRPTIENGGSVSVKCVPIHLRPSANVELITLWLVAEEHVTAPVRVTWTATATNVDGTLAGEFHVPTSPDPLDLTRALRHAQRN